MSRDYSIFPDDENGDVLWRMKEKGDNLKVARQINFSVIFATEATALKFAVYLLKNDQKVSFSPYEEHDELPWQVEVHPMMLPTH
jgi:Regulator of ribonuclease activity B